MYDRNTESERILSKFFRPTFDSEVFCEKNNNRPLTATLPFDGAVSASLLQQFI